MLLMCRKHLAELNYPAPRTISKLVDQVRLGSVPCYHAYSNAYDRFSSSEVENASRLTLAILQRVLEFIMLGIVRLWILDVSSGKVAVT